MKKVLLILIVIFCTSSLFSQERTEYKETLRKYMQICGYECALELQIKSAIKSIKSYYTNISEKKLNEISNEIRKKGFDDYIEMSLDAFKKILSKEDLEKAIEFYKTPLGKKIVDNTLINDISVVSEKWSLKIQQKILDLIKQK